MIRDNLLEVNHLKTYFYTDEGVVKSVDDVSFSVQPSRTLGIVGESGCGKSITLLSIMRLIENPPGKIVAGEILYNGENLLKKNKEEMRQIRGNNIAMIFQEPMTSLNPVYTIGEQILESISIHRPELDKGEARERALAMLKMVNIPMPEKRFNEYPHQLSGGMRQRVMIAIALSCEPDLLLCDEPTTALDVTVQAQILELINDLKKKARAAIIMVTHDLGVISEVADDVMVMYAGKVVEFATVDQIFAQPMHPYTCGLINCIPSLDKEVERLSTIPGMVPSFNEMPKGCAFAPRCSRATQRCKENMPELIDIGERKVRCFLYEGKDTE
ncbi:MAG: hypothetical protein H6Q74_1652 [Firmicutes bacterium]|nr:hypothetical protein [Bacillota bacterium]